MAGRRPPPTRPLASPRRLCKPGRSTAPGRSSWTRVRSLRASPALPCHRRNPRPLLLLLLSPPPRCSSGGRPCTGAASSRSARRSSALPAVAFHCCNFKIAAFLQRELIWGFCTAGRGGEGEETGKRGEAAETGWGEKRALLGGGGGESRERARRERANRWMHGKREMQRQGRLARLQTMLMDRVRACMHACKERGELRWFSGGGSCKETWQAAASPGPDGSVGKSGGRDSSRNGAASGGREDTRRLDRLPPHPPTQQEHCAGAPQNACKHGSDFSPQRFSLQASLVAMQLLKPPSY